MKKIKFVLPLLLLALFFSCKNEGTNGSGNIKTELPIAINKDNIVLVIQSNGAVKQLEFDNKGNLKEVKKVPVKNVKSVGFYKWEGWALTYKGQLYTWSLFDPQEVEERSFNKSIIKACSSSSGEHFACLFSDSTVYSSIMNVGNAHAEKGMIRDTLWNIKDIVVTDEALISLTTQNDIIGYKKKEFGYEISSDKLPGDIQKIGVTTNRGMRGKYDTNYCYVKSKNNEITCWNNDKLGVTEWKLEGKQHYLFDYMVLGMDGKLTKYLNVSNEFLREPPDETIYYYCNRRYGNCFLIDKKGNLFIRKNRSKQDIKVEGIKIKLDFFEGVDSLEI